jgi:hypothetical protein
VLVFEGAEFGAEERLKIIPVWRPNNGRSAVILIDGNLLRRMLNLNERRN